MHVHAIIYLSVLFFVNQSIKKKEFSVLINGCFKLSLEHSDRGGRSYYVHGRRCATL